MMVRQFTVASLLSLALLSLAASVPTAKAGPLDYCKEDAARLCRGVPEGGGHLVDCLKQHNNEVSVGCAKASQRIKAEMDK
jgi:Cysteine rich repeat